MDLIGKVGLIAISQTPDAVLKIKMRSDSIYSKKGWDLNVINTFFLKKS